MWFKVVRKIEQIINDHRAMDLVRKHKGDIHLISCYTSSGSQFECIPWQREYCSIVKKDPSNAIICAVLLAELMTGNYGDKP